MVIFHLKYSYLDWRVIPCRRKTMRFFHHFLNIFSCWFSFRLNQIFQVHDMTINFLLFFLFLFLSTPSNDVCHRWPSKLKHLFSVWGLFWKVGLLAQGCLYHFCPKRIMAQKCYREMGNFGQHAPRHQSKMISRYHRHETCVFGHRKSFGRLEAVASLDAYQITNYQFFFKNSSFLLPDFEEFEKKFLN